MMSWYKVWMMVPGTDGDAESGPHEPIWWKDMVEAETKEEATAQANANARREWEQPNEYEPGVPAPSYQEMGSMCPVCTGAEKATDAEHEAWVAELAGMEMPFH